MDKSLKKAESKIVEKLHWDPSICCGMMTIICFVIFVVLLFAGVAYQHGVSDGVRGDYSAKDYSVKLNWSNIKKLYSTDKTDGGKQNGNTWEEDQTKTTKPYPSS